MSNLDETVANQESSSASGAKPAFFSRLVSWPRTLYDLVRRRKEPLSRHEEVASLIAKRYCAKCKRGKRPEIETSFMAVEVESGETLCLSRIEHLEDLYTQRVYVALEDDKDIDLAKEVTKGTRIGILNSRGSVVQASSG